MRSFFCIIISLSLAISHARAIVPPEVEVALQRAGENRRSLESLLGHYSEDPERYAAVCFLISNMPFHDQGGRVEEQDTRLDSLIRHNADAYRRLIIGTSPEQQETDPLHKTIKDAARLGSEQSERLQLTPPTILEEDLPDICTIDASFLKRQIDCAFSLRERLPHLKSLSLSFFFEYVLSYRGVTGYPLVVDAQTLHEIYGTFLSPYVTKGVKPFSEQYNRTLWWLRKWGGKYPFEETCAWKAEYDNDIKTAPDQWPDVTLRLKEAERVDCLRYHIKSADNHVRRKHSYDLLQWDGEEGWILVDQRKAEKDELSELRLETNELYWLSDTTEGHEELPFYLNEKGEQVFPHEWLLPK